MQLDPLQHACGWGLELALVSGGQPGESILVPLGSARSGSTTHTRVWMRSSDAQRHVVELELRFDGAGARGTAAWQTGDAPVTTPGGPEPFALVAREPIVIPVAEAPPLTARLRLCPVRAPLFCPHYGVLVCDDGP